MWISQSHLTITNLLHFVLDIFMLHFESKQVQRTGYSVNLPTVASIEECVVFYYDHVIPGLGHPELLYM